MAIADPDEVAAFATELTHNPERPAALVWALTPADAHPTGPGDQPLVDTADEINASVVVLDRSAQNDDLVVHQVAALHERGVRVRTLSLFYDEWLGKLPVSELERMSLMFDIGEVHRVRYGRIKRLIDIVAGLLTLPVLVLALPFVLLGNLVANRGPLLYRQARVGKGGVEFEILKFRTMTPDAGPSEWTTDDDPRITAFGSLLRRTHLDELPQAVNILKGRAGDRRSPARATALRRGAAGEDPLLRAPSPGASRPHRLGPGQVPLRGQRDRRPGEAPVRVLLPAPPGTESRPAHPGPHPSPRRGGGRPVTDASPTVSIILPVLDEQGYIRDCLDSLLDQDYASVVEILVVDGGSSDDTRAIVSEFPAPVRLVDNPRRSAAAAMNVGIDAAKGAVIVRADAHTLYAGDYVRRCVEVLEETGADNVGGPMRPVGTTNFGRAVAAITTSPIGIGPGRFHYSERREEVDTVYLGCWRRETLEALGGYDESSLQWAAEDQELNFRLRKRGGRVVLDPTIRSAYFPRATPRSLGKQYRNYGVAKASTWAKHRSLPSWRPLAPAALVAGTVTCALTTRGWARLAVPVAHGLLCAAEGMRLARDPGVAPHRAMAAVEIAHWSYGVGFWSGVWRIVRRRSFDPRPASAGLSVASLPDDAPGFPSLLDPVAGLPIGAVGQVGPARAAQHGRTRRGDRPGHGLRRGPGQ